MHNKLTFLSLLTFLVFITSAYSQWNISGNVTSIPSNTIPKAKITFTNLSTKKAYSTINDTLTGNYNILLPKSGVFQEKIEVIGDYLIIDTLNITGNITINEKPIEQIQMNSNLYISHNVDNLTFFKVESGTLSDSPNQVFSRSRDPPLVLWPHNYSSGDPNSMPQDWRSRLDSAEAIYAAALGKPLFTEVNSNPTIGIEMEYTTYANMPYPAAASTGFDYNHTVSYYATDVLSISQVLSTYLREIWRMTGLFTNAGDPSFVSYIYGTNNNSLAPDEVNCLRLAYDLPNGTNMHKYVDSPVTVINWPAYVSTALTDTVLHSMSLPEVVLSTNVRDNIRSDNSVLNYTASSTNGSALVRNDSLIAMPTGFGASTVTLTGTDSDNASISTSSKLNIIEIPNYFSILNPPANDTASYINGKLNITWNKSSGASGYKVRVAGPGLDTTFTTTDTTESLDTKLFNEKAAYKINASAYNAYGDTTTATNNGLTFYTPTITAVSEDKNTLPTDFKLYQNYPNPFNPTTVISYQLSAYSYVTLKVYDVLGNAVAALVNENKPAGRYTVEFNASNLSSGIYFCRMTAGSFTSIKKLLLLK